MEAIQASTMRVSSRQVRRLAAPGRSKPIQSAGPTEFDVDPARQVVFDFNRQGQAEHVQRPVGVAQGEGAIDFKVGDFIRECDVAATIAAEFGN